MNGCHNEDSEAISCECAKSGNKPVDFLGDHVCSERTAKVKDMIEKFDVAKKNSSKHDLPQVKCDSKKTSTSTPPIERKNSVKALSASYEKLPHIKPTKSFFKMEDTRKKSNISLENCGGLSYQSRTTIAKTPNGVRIITDIFYDSNQGSAAEHGVGSRIETDIPPSKILQDFQKNYSNDLD